MPLPSVHQTFALENCRDLLNKLEWEIEQLAKAGQKVPELTYHAFNAAVTAWHLADWIYEELPESFKVASGLSELRDFQDMAREQCRALHVCRQIATASKHSRVDRHFDPNISTAVSAGASFKLYLDALPGDIEWQLKILDEQIRREAIDVFREAHEYWMRFIHQHQLG